MAFSYYKALTIQSGQVPSSQSNFPVLLPFLGGDADLKSVGNGGHVQSASGYDIRPYSDSSLTTALTFELVAYDASSGTFEMHVKMTAVTSGVIYLGYGDSGLSSDGSSTSTWDSNFKTVFHFKDGSSLSGNDSTSNANNATSLGSATAGTGQVDGGAVIHGGATEQDIVTPYAGQPTDFTMEAWFKSTGHSPAPGYDRIVDKEFTNGVVLCRNAAANNTWGAFFIDPTAASPVMITLADGSWHHIAVKRTGTALKVIGDGGAVSNSATVVGTAISNAPLNIGWSNVTDLYNSFVGTIDEVRFSEVARADDWITAEYNNHVAPTSFWSTGSEVPINTNGTFAAVPTATCTFIGNASTSGTYASIPTGTCSFTGASTASSPFTDIPTGTCLFTGIEYHSWASSPNGVCAFVGASTAAGILASTPNCVTLWQAGLTNGILSATPTATCSLVGIATFTGILASAPTATCTFSAIGLEIGVLASTPRATCSFVGTKIADLNNYLRRYLNDRGN